MSDRVLISAGEVIDVQLTSETIVVEGAGGRRRRGPRREVARTTQRMRLFLRDGDGKERKFDFEDCALGVREGHRCAVIRGKPAAFKDPVHLVLVNISTDERDVFEDAVYAFLNRKRFFGPMWKAFGLALAMIPFGIFYSQIILGHHDTMTILESFWWSVFFAFLTYPIFWGGFALWDRMTETARFKRERAELLSEIDGRLRPYRSAQTPPSPAPTPPPAETTKE